MFDIRSFYSLKKRKITSSYSNIYFVNLPNLKTQVVVLFFITKDFFFIKINSQKIMHHNNIHGIAFIT